MQKKSDCGKIETNRRRFLCPTCGKHTLLFLMPGTMIRDLPMKCKRCGAETVVNIAIEPEPLSLRH